jgi:hypothetical protein
MKCPEYEKKCEWATSVANLPANREVEKFIVLLSGFWISLLVTQYGQSKYVSKTSRGLKVALSRQRKRQRKDHICRAC